ncbi:hypothetical protein TwortDSMZ_109 [Staphylococcus phage Twort]|uniref:ORF083 n=2 Tax=Staphylococcus phage Twort (strain DSM 17442 / HER 48) TaxID=2908167 RepID=Q4Z9E5_BPTWO|nr:hypothetical protein TwortORF083 [Staphylococcus phage Twort]AAX92377.1 ORF083 [Staphylococcus phage Twort]QIW89108.1 hypothetical protein TwortDSMZ_109 [Staphylococcus phage Twort]
MFYSERRTTCKERQRKKHYSQMTLQEKKDCVSLLQNVFEQCKFFKMTPHFKEKSLTRIDFDLLKNFILHNNYAFLNIIEYNETKTRYNTQKRIVLKYPEIVKVKGIPCFQYLVITNNGKLVTTYYNKINDVHKTLDLTYYDKNLKISVDIY